MRAMGPLRAAVVAAVVVLASAGCGGGAGEAAPGPAAASVTAPGSGSEPPPVTVVGSSGPVVLQPWTYCWMSDDGGACVDGAAPQDPPDVGGAEELTFSFPVLGWSFRASSTPAGQLCGRIYTVPAERTGEVDHVLRPAGPAGTYDVTLVLDGEEHRARAVWPRDEVPDGVSVDLRFDPPLPALAGPDQSERGRARRMVAPAPVLHSAAVITVLLRFDHHIDHLFPEATHYADADGVLTVHRDEQEVARFPVGSWDGVYRSAGTHVREQDGRERTAKGLVVELGETP